MYVTETYDVNYVCQKRPIMYCQLCMSKETNNILSTMYVTETYDVNYVCHRDIWCQLCMSQRHIMSTMYVTETYDVNYVCHRDIWIMWCRMCMSKEKRHVNRLLSNMFIKRDVHMKIGMQVGDMWSHLGGRERERERDRERESGDMWSHMSQTGMVNNESSNMSVKRDVQVGIGMQSSCHAKSYESDY